MYISNQINSIYQNNLSNSYNKTNLACYYNNPVSEKHNVNFKGKTKNILLKLFRFRVGEGYTTKGHMQNVFYDTKLNDSLRNPGAAIIDTFGMLNVSSSMSNFFTPTLALAKDVISESPEKMKMHLNAEFELLKPTKKTIKLYRGLSFLSDETYHKFLNYKKGDIVVPDKGFAYMTDNKNTTLGYATRNNTCSEPVILNIEIPKKSQISQLIALVPSLKPYKLLSFKNETVVPAESQYEVLSDSFIDKDGILQIFLKYLNKW